VLRLAVHHHATPVARDASHAVVVAVLRLAVQVAVKGRQTRRRALVVTK
jgi:hypothetical protein